LLKKLGFVLLLWLAGALSAAAETAPAAAAPAAAAPSATELQGLVDTLRDDKARAALVGQLQALIAANRAAAEPAQPVDFLARMTQRLDVLVDELLVGAAVVLEAPRLANWVSAQFTDEAARGRWAELLLAFAVVFGAAVLAEWLTRRLLARIGQHAPAHEAEGRGMRMLLAAAGVLVEALPIVAFATTALFVMAMTLPAYSTGREAIRILVWATAGYRLTVAVASAVLVPRPAWPSLVPAGEETRNYLLIWVRRFAFWGIFGIPLTGAAWWLGVPGAMHALMLKGVGLVLAVLAIVFILQNRPSIADWIRGAPSEETPSGWARLRGYLGDTWHILAIVYVVALDAVYTLNNQGGSGFVLRATGISLVALIAARLLVQFVERLSERGFAVAPDLKTRFPMLEGRANRYVPLVIKVTHLAIYAVALLIVLQAWNLHAFEWFRTEIGRRASGTVVSLALVIALAVLAWEILSAAIERNLAALDQAGAPSRARRRTLLPLLRTAMLCVIIAIAGLTVLSQLGVDIGPLLAGAGIVGVAVGFGSQALVKDIITGLFILAEDQIAVGDIVDVGKGHSGVVEAITVRTIRLRDQGGVVHTVPFSEVTTVKNMTRDFTYAVFRIGIAYGEDIDRVVEILRGLCEELAQDAELGPLIANPFDYQGVDSLDEFSVVLLFRVRTLPGKQWSISRALNRLIKIAFREHGVATRDPSPVLVTGPASGALTQPAAADDPAAPRRRTA
jgi:small conductance mechanosensitive channel